MSGVQVMLHGADFLLQSFNQHQMYR